MAYEKRTWVSGTTPCSSENFNHMEQGIADAHDKLDELSTKFIYRDKTYNSLTIGSKEVVMRYPDSVGGYTPVFAIAIAGTVGKYEWFAAQVTSAGNMIIENKFTGSITTDVTVRIFYIKS